SSGRPLYPWLSAQPQRVYGRTDAAPTGRRKRATPVELDRRPARRDPPGASLDERYEASREATSIHVTLSRRSLTITMSDAGETMKTMNRTYRTNGTYRTRIL